MTLDNKPTIIYTASGAITVTLILTNTTDTPKELNVASSDKVYNNKSSMAENAFTQWDIPLANGEVIVAYSNVQGVIDYVVMDSNGADITPAPVADTTFDQLKAIAQTAVGKTPAQWTDVQKTALLAICVKKIDGLNPLLQVKPLGQWVK